MEEDTLFSMRELNCNHKKQEIYTQRNFDILNGFELHLTRCLNCHKIIILKAKKLSSK